MPAYAFDDFVFLTESDRLIKNGSSIKIRPQTCRLLALLIQRKGEVVSREDLVRDIWDGAYVNDQTVFQGINQLRNVLGDDPKAPKYLKTLPRKGYQWIAPVRPTPAESKSTPQATEAHRSALAEWRRPELETPSPRAPSRAEDTAQEVTRPASIPSRCAENPPRAPRPRVEGGMTQRDLFRRLGTQALPVASTLLALDLAPMPTIYAHPNAKHRETGAPRIAFLPFFNAGGDPDLQWIELGLMDMVSRWFHLTAPGLAIPADEVLGALGAHGTHIGADLSIAQLTVLSRELRAEWVVSGEIDSQEDHYFLAYRAISPTFGIRESMIRTTSIKKLADRLQNQLAGLVQPGVGTLRYEVLTENPFANESFAQGLHWLERGEAAKAAIFLEGCILREPDFLWAEYHLARCLMQTGLAERAADRCVAVLERSLTRGDQALAANLLRLQGDIAGIQGDQATRATRYEQSLAKWQSLGDPNMIAALSAELVEAWSALGFSAKAGARWREAMGLATQCGDLVGQALLYDRMARVASARQDATEAVACWRLAIDAWHRWPEDARCVASHIGLAETLDRIGQVDEAASIYRETRSLVARLHDRAAELALSIASAQSAIRQRDRSRARLLLEEAQSLAAALQDRTSEARIAALQKGCEAEGAGSACPEHRPDARFGTETAIEAVVSV
ncbi:Winged helix-turn-helix domain-containing protein [Sulfidibacter corallicola]